MKKWMSVAFLTLVLFLLAMPVYAESDVEKTEDTAAKYLTVVYGAKTVTCENEIIIKGDFTFLPLSETLSGPLSVGSGFRQKDGLWVKRSRIFGVK